MSTANVLICAPKRTAIGSLDGSLATVPATELAIALVRALLAETKIDPAKIDELVLGCVLMAGLGQAPARQVVVKSGLPTSVQAMTINKVCSSGLKAVMLAADSVQLGRAGAVLAGGMENMSLAPYLLRKMRAGARLGHAQAEDSILSDGLWDVYKDFHMGECAEICADKYKLSREAQDAFALESYRRANEAIAKGYFAKEIVPVTVRQGKQETIVAADEEPGRVKVDKVPLLKAVFRKEGTVTAANASSINDGAALMLVCNEQFAKEQNLKPVARIVAQAWHGQEPEWFTTAPVGAVTNVLKAAGKKAADIDLFEINEAFSSVALACQSDLGIDAAKLNVTGGAVALGHPIGASGARILTTLIHNLERLNKRSGIASLCNGGGEATAMLIERIS